MRVIAILFAIFFLVGCAEEQVGTPTSARELETGTYFTYNRKDSDTISFSSKRSVSRIDRWFETSWKVTGDSILIKNSRGFESHVGYSLMADTLRLRYVQKGSGPYETVLYRVISFNKEKINLIDIASPKEVIVRNDI